MRKEDSIFKVASVTKRLFAYIIDFVPISIIVFQFFILFTPYSIYIDKFNKEVETIIIEKQGNIEEGESLMPSYLDLLSSSTKFTQYTNYISIITILIIGMYGAYAESSSWQGTFGKKFMKIHVEDIDGMPLSGELAFKRNVFKIIILSSFPIFMIWVIFDRRNRSIYDILSKTIVMSNRKNRAFSYMKKDTISE